MITNRLLAVFLVSRGSRKVGLLTLGKLLLEVVSPCFRRGRVYPYMNGDLLPGLIFIEAAGIWMLLVGTTTHGRDQFDKI